MKKCLLKKLLKNNFPLAAIACSKSGNVLYHNYRGINLQVKLSSCELTLRTHRLPDPFSSVPHAMSLQHALKGFVSSIHFIALKT